MLVIQIGDTLVSFDLIDRFFYCDFAQCKGACCVEGEAGAPLERAEFDVLRRLLPAIWDFLSPKAQEVIGRQGVGYVDGDNDVVTSIVDGRDCVFTCYEPGGCCRCALERAYLAGRTGGFIKPVSCQLYPVRVTVYKDYQAVNYHRWKICRAAEVSGERKGILLYRFLREPLIRKFGKEWYDALDRCAEEFVKR